MSEMIVKNPSLNKMNIQQLHPRVTNYVLFYEIDLNFELNESDFGQLWH